MTCIRRAPHIDPHTVRTVVDRLDRHVAPHLSPDIPNYAGGRAEWIDLGKLAALDGRGLACWCHPTLPRSGTRPARWAATNSKKKFRDRLKLAAARRRLAMLRAYRRGKNLVLDAPFQRAFHRSRLPVGSADVAAGNRGV